MLYDTQTHTHIDIQTKLQNSAIQRCARLIYAHMYLYTKNYKSVRYWSTNSRTTIPRSIALTITPRGHILNCLWEMHESSSSPDLSSYE